MTAHEWQDVFDARKDAGRYLMFLVDIVDSRSHTGDASIAARYEMPSVMNDFFDRICSMFPDAVCDYGEEIWERDTWAMSLVSDGFLVVGDAYAVVLDGDAAPSVDELTWLFEGVCAEHGVPFAFHCGAVRFDSLDRLDAGDDVLTVNHCFALLERDVKSGGVVVEAEPVRYTELYRRAGC